MLGVLEIYLQALHSMGCFERDCLRDDKNYFQHLVLSICLIAKWSSDVLWGSEESWEMVKLIVVYLV